MQTDEFVAAILGLGVVLVDAWCLEFLSVEVVCVVFADVGGVEMGGGGKDGVTNRKTKILFAEIVFFYI